RSPYTTLFRSDRLGSGRAPLFHDLKRRAWTAEARSAYMARTLSGMEYETTAMPAKVKSYQDPHELLAKLESKAAMWERVARDNKERAEDFERAAQAVREGADSVTVGRTTYTL